jgi:signal peptidase I
MNLWQSYRGWKARRQLRHDAVALLKEACRVRRRYGHRLTAAQTKDLEARSAALQSALDDNVELQTRFDQLGALLDGGLAFAKKSQARQYVESIGAVVFVALVLRSFVVEAYQIPSGSMIPTLEVGDRIWVNKLIYGVRLPFTDIKLGTHYRPPQRGEIIVFEHPNESDKDLIKRVVAVGGDTVEMRDNTVFVNGVPTARVHDSVHHYWDFHEGRQNENGEKEPDKWVDDDADAWREKIGGASFLTFHALVGGQSRFFDPIHVPPDSLFVMGDNRDNSSDSRVWGFVPLNLVRGKAMVVWWSSGQPEGVRLKRFGHLIQ